MTKHTVAVMGLGVRGKIHVNGIAENKGRYRIVGLCDNHKENMDLMREVFSL